MILENFYYLYRNVQNKSENFYNYNTVSIKNIRGNTSRTHLYLVHLKLVHTKFYHISSEKSRPFAKYANKNANLFVKGAILLAKMPDRQPKLRP